jgi:hypothetical protein
MAAPIPMTVPGAVVLADTANAVGVNACVLVDGVVVVALDVMLKYRLMAVALNISPFSTRFRVNRLDNVRSVYVSTVQFRPV